MWTLYTRRLAAILLAASSCRAALDLRALPEFTRPDPFGGIVECDRKGAAWLNAIRFRAARGSYVSFHLVADANGSGKGRLIVEFPLTPDIYREWFHWNAPDGKYYPDALIPVHAPIQIPAFDSDNQVPNQVSQAFWVDLWIPASAEPKTYRGQAILSSGSDQRRVPIEVTVLAAAVPEQDAVTLDNNSYGTSWLVEQYPKTLAHLADSRKAEDELFRLIHDYHGMFYEHRGTFHQLGYGHAGKVGPEFAPELQGTGRLKHVSSWDRFDRHYGPLLDGSAFQNSRRGAKPIPYVYLPVNPEWPASFLWWGEPGYEVEFTRVLAEMEHHFREKHWTSTRFEVFFNHKKRYKGFHWDGDEIRFARDNENLLTYYKMLRKAVPADSPVQFVLRADSSWSMEQQFQALKGVVTFWVAGEGMFSWYAGQLKVLKQRGDTVWTYGGTPTVQSVSALITLNPLRSWVTGVDGFVRWLAVSPGPEPWFKFEGGAETLVYPGERFGIAGPLASIRLKLQRNCLQDLALLERNAMEGSRERVVEEVVHRFNGTTLAEWKNSRPALAKPLLDWNNADIEDALKPYEARFANPDPLAWQRVREFALDESQRRL